MYLHRSTANIDPPVCSNIITLPPFHQSHVIQTRMFRVDCIRYQFEMFLCHHQISSGSRATAIYPAPPDRESSPE